MSFITAVISGFGFTVGAILSLFFMCFVVLFINALHCEIQAILLVRKVEKEIRRKEKSE